MVLKETLQQVLAEPYSLPYFSQHVLQPVFSESVTVFASPIPMQVNPSEERMVKSIKKYGEVKLSDYRQIDLYEVALSDSVVVERSKVSIGAVVKKLIAGNNAVLVNFYYPGQPKKSWRFSFIAKDQIIEEGAAKKVETNPKRYTYVLGPNERCRTAAERFNKLSLETDFKIIAFQEAFSVEKLSKNFFDEYKKHYAAFVKHLCKREIKASVFKDDEKAARNFAKKLLGRIVFLYFVQKKGWLGASNDKWQDGNPNFVEDLFIASGKKETFYPLWLRTLFYDSLNNPDRLHNDFKLPDGTTVKVPYLNGGLFEDDDPKGSAKYLTFPPRLFEDLFEFFNQYNFTIYEDSPDDHTIAVDPEMLGHIFENLLEDNKDKGAYYTPKEIVHYMCHESIIEYLSTKLDIPESVAYQELGADQTGMFGNEAKKGQLDILKEHKIQSPGITREDVRKFITKKEVTPQIIEHAKEINALLDEVKICDPAIGSGAFPMGLLHEIFDAKQFLKEIAQVPELQKVTNAEMKENIIQNSIYGVDIEKGAVDIARLRFWLSLIVDEELPRPLPNLDFKIVVGDSLLPKFEDEVVDIDWEAKYTSSSTEKLYNKMKTDLQELVAAQKKYFSAKTEKEKEKQKLAIRDLKIEILLNQLQLDKSKYENRATVTEELFDSKKKEKEKKLENELRIAGYNSAIKKLLHLQKHTNKPLQFFDWKLNFPEILNSAIAQQEGFDIVIGNPPYGAEFSATEKDVFRTDYESAKTVSGKLKGSVDSFSLFIDRGMRLCNNNSSLAYIVPLAFTSSESMAALHNIMFNTCEKIIVSTYSNRPHKIFESADQRVAIVVLHKNNMLVKQILTTKVNKRYKDTSIEKLMNSLQFVNSKRYLLNGRIPKVGSQIELDILCKLFSIKTKLLDLFDERGKHVYYRTSGGRYYNIITIIPTGSMKEKPIKVKAELQKLVGGILSSNLYYWFYHVYSNTLDMKSYELEIFPVPIDKLPSNMIADVDKIYLNYLENLEQNARIVKADYNNVNSFKEYKARKSKHLIDKIDLAIKDAYGLTDDEVKFLINYDIEFRTDE